jgi:Tol biopolymer transport system component/DNA-binding winged helix-turn-helix (wHTH) protein
MLKEGLPAQLYRFGEYELDLSRRLLLMNGRRVALTPKAFDVLAALVQRHGQIVTKNELLQLVWPDTVVEEISLTRNISVLRKTLGEKPDEHNFIVTVPGTGYGFVAAVEHAAHGVPQAQAPAPAVPARKRRSWVLALALTPLAIVLAWYLRPTAAPAIWRSRPLTTYPGFEQAPALSPDGRQVAFAWEGDKQDNFDIYIKPVGPGGPLRLTTNPAQDVNPVWSPDGASIAFLRHLDTDRNELVLMPAQGGPERKLADTRAAYRTDWPRSLLAWSPDGNWLAVSDREPADPVESLFLVSARTGEKRRITTALRGSFGDFMPAFAPDGHAIAFCRLQGYFNAEVHLLPLSANLAPAGEPRRLTAAGQPARDPVWTRDAKHLLFVGRQQLQIIATAGSGGSRPVPLVEDNISQLSLGRHLVYTRRAVDNNIWQADLRAPGIPPGAPRLLIASTRSDEFPRYSPDGRKIAFASNRSGSWEIWMAEADGSNPAPLSVLGSTAGLIAWSPDGRRIAFDVRSEGQSDIFTIPAEGGERKRLTNDSSDDYLPAYSHDGRWIYFTSKRTGRNEIWKMPSTGGQAIQVTHQEPGYLPMDSPDGKTLYYCHELPEKGIWQMSLEGGEEKQVAGPYSTRLCGLTVTSEGLYYTADQDAGKHHTIQFVSLATGAARPVVVSERPLGKLSLSLSPDRRYIIYSQYDQAGSDLMLIENFQPR